MKPTDLRLFKNPPLDHQLAALRKAWNHRAYALFHDPGTGKTYTAITLACARFQFKQIDSMVVIAPTSIKDVWVEQFEQHCACPYAIHVHRAGGHRVTETFIAMDTDILKVLVIGVESLSNGKGAILATKFTRYHKSFTVVDESSRIKNPTKLRSRAAHTIGSHSAYRMILTGTPITQGMEDLYSQFLFLHPSIIGTKSYFLFKNMYCVMGGYKGKQVMGYQNQAKLVERLKPYCDIVKKEDALDLPEKVYQKIVVTPTKDQLSAIKQLKDIEEAEVEGDTLIAPTMLERMTRFQQIIGGHFPYNNIDEDVDARFVTKKMPGSNPKLDALMESIGDLDNDRSVIIWARFRPEIELITQSLRDKFGQDSAVTFYGADNEEGRVANVKKFRSNPKTRFLVSNQSVGGMGQTWTEATYVYYYSNSFSMEDRVQSEDRAHRKGQELSVTYIDIEADHKYDKILLAAIHRKVGIANVIEKRMAV